jgi:hypothetical protein
MAASHEDFTLAIPKKKFDQLTRTGVLTTLRLVFAFIAALECKGDVSTTEC